MKITVALAIIPSVLFMAACSKTGPAAPDFIQQEAVESGSATEDINEDKAESIELKIVASYPSQSSAEDATKVSLEESGLKWNGDEVASVIVGKFGTTANKTQGARNPLPSVSNGVFQGTVRVANLSTSDIHAVVIPYSNGAYFAYKNSSNRLVMPVPAEQVQEKPGVMNEANFPMFAEITNADLDGGNTVDNLQLYSAVNIARFKVYGRHPGMDDGEVLKSIRLDADDRLSGTCEFILGKSSNEFNSNGESYAAVNLAEDVTVSDKTADDAPVVYLALVTGGDRTVNKVTVTTDKAIYTKPVSLSYTKRNLSNMAYYKYRLNLANGWTREASSLQWSTDGGATWSGTFPDGTFSKLAVKSTYGRVLSPADLLHVKEAVSAQPEAVELDLSGITYADAVFPAIFQAEAEEPFTKLASIKFPSNVTEIEERAFQWNSALRAVDLTGITTINTKAFYRSGLVDLTVPSTVTSMPGWLTFGCLPDLETVYYDSKAPQIGGKGSDGNNHAHFAFADMTLNYGTNNPTEVTTDAAKNSVSYPVVFTVGPNCASFPRYMFRYNKKIKKIIFKKIPALSNYSLNNLAGVEVLDFSECTSIATNSNAGSGYGAPGTSADRKIIVRPSLAETVLQNNPWRQFVLESGFDVITSENVANGTGSVNARIGTYNIRVASGDKSGVKSWTTRRPFIKESVSKLDFDIFGIQEAQGSSSYPQQSDLRSDLGSTYNFVFFRPNTGTNYESIGIAYKKAVWEMLDVNCFWLGPDPDMRTASDKPTTGTYAGSSFYRGAICSVFRHKTTGIKIFFMCTHGMLSSDDRTTYANVYASQETVLNPEGLPSFFTGDFNAGPAHESSVIYRTHWYDSYLTATAKGGIEYTFNGYSTAERDSSSRIDYVYWKGLGVTPNYYECDNSLYGTASDTFASDHFPVFTDFTITR